MFVCVCVCVCVCERERERERERESVYCVTLDISSYVIYLKKDIKIHRTDIKGGHLQISLVEDIAFEKRELGQEKEDLLCYL